MPETILPHPYQPIGSMRGDFISMITHDLRAPLTNLSMFLSLTRSGIYSPADPVFDDRLGQLIPELARINRLLDELLDLNDCGDSQAKQSRRPISSTRMIDAAINAVRYCAHSKDISIVKECVHVSVIADFDQLTRVVINLLQNAIKFSPAGSKILIRSMIKGNDLHVSVIDEGPGVTAHDSERIFQPYVQASAIEKDGGVGLGLSIAQAFVKTHGGKIGVKPRNGARGSHFWFSVPRNAGFDSFDFTPS